MLFGGGGTAHLQRAAMHRPSVAYIHAVEWRVALAKRLDGHRMFVNRLRRLAGRPLPLPAVAARSQPAALCGRCSSRSRRSAEEWRTDLRREGRRRRTRREAVSECWAAPVVRTVAHGVARNFD